MGADGLFAQEVEERAAEGWPVDFVQCEGEEKETEENRPAEGIGACRRFIYGLALGYNSTIVPVILLAITSIVSIALCGLFGVALAAIGMLSNLCIGLAIDAYGPISDNAGGKIEFNNRYSRNVTT